MFDRCYCIISTKCSITVAKIVALYFVNVCQSTPDCSFLLSWLYDLPVVLIFTVNYVIPVTEYGHTFLTNLKKSVFPVVQTKNIHNFPSLFTFLTSKLKLPHARARL